MRPAGLLVTCALVALAPCVPAAALAAAPSAPLPVDERDSLAPLPDGVPPRTPDELWAGYDPRHEPLEAEVLREWEEDGVVLRVLRYRIGVFKGRKAWMAAVYGFPKGVRNLPGLVQIHGGGQFADHRAPLANGRRGYATISLAWAGRISAPGYAVNADGVALFWEGKTSDPAYRLTTDWGALDAYHAPCRYPKNNFQTVAPAAWTLDAVESPRNNPWFLCTLAARRALTFLESQPEVDGSRLGVYGHSMGGKLTVMTAAADPRVKAAVPSCGGVSDRPQTNAVYAATINDDVHLRRITCPIMFLNPANDFHGRIDDLQSALGEIGSREWRISCSPHHNHQDTPEFEGGGPLWFDQHLKGTFQWPGQPEVKLDLASPGGSPRFRIIPDASRPIAGLDVFYTQDVPLAGAKESLEDTKTRFWHHASVRREGDAWVADLPLHEVDRPLWVFGNVLYGLEQPVTGAGYYYRPYSSPTVNLSSRMLAAAPAELAAARVRPARSPLRLIESFTGDWQKDWFRYDAAGWERRTHKVRDACWAAPAGASLAFEVRAALPRTLVIGLDEHAATVTLAGSADWQRVTLSPADFLDATRRPLPGWQGIRELRLGPRETLKGKADGKPVTRLVGGEWPGPAPEFRHLRWEDPPNPR